MDSLKRAIKRLPYLRVMIQERDQLRAIVDGLCPPGHYDCPYPDFVQLRQEEHEIFDRVPSELPGIDLNEKHQLDLLDRFAEHYHEFPYSESGQSDLRYKCENGLFCHHDAIVLFCMLRELQPARVVEVGSGWSSAVMLDSNERFFQGRIQLTCIDPYPQRLLSLLKPGDCDTINLIAQPVQAVPLTIFTELGAGDVLFIDSPHVVKTGGPVSWLLFEVIPRIASGVYVHIHDIFYPFEYPREWLFNGKAYNELYFIRAFLQYNHAFQIEYFCSMIGQRYSQKLAEHLPLAVRDIGGSIWLKKL